MFTKINNKATERNSKNCRKKGQKHTRVTESEGENTISAPLKENQISLHLVMKL